MRLVESTVSKDYQITVKLNLSVLCGLQVDTFHSHVRPRINPKLSEFCSRLTGVTQEMVDNALPFVDVFDSFRMWMQSHRLGHNNARYAFVTDG